MSSNIASRHNEVGVYAARVEDRNILTWIQKVTDTSPAVMIVGGNYHWSDCFWGRKDVEFVENGLFSKLTTVPRFEIFVYEHSVLEQSLINECSFLEIGSSCNTHDVSIITPNSNPARGYNCHYSLFNNFGRQFEFADAVEYTTSDNTLKQFIRTYHDTDLSELTGQFVHGAPIGKSHDQRSLELDRVCISSGSSLVVSLGFVFNFFGFQNYKLFGVRVFRV